MAPSGQAGAGDMEPCAEDTVQGVPGVSPEAVGQRGPLVALALQP